MSIVDNILLHVPMACIAVMWLRKVSDTHGMLRVRTKIRENNTVYSSIDSVSQLRKFDID